MKKALFLLLILPAMVLAAPVDLNVAQQVAENFINAPETDASGSVNKAPRKQKRMARSPKQVVNDQQFYIFNSEDGEGFVIVAADDVAHPILGYSKTGSFETVNLPENLRWWLSEYDRQILWAQDNNITQSDEIAAEWQQSLANQLQAATPVVAPLIQTQWDQSPYYNEQCPYYTTYKINVGNYHFLEDVTYYTPTGCGATALAQVMKYYNWPQQGTGYKWYSTANCGKISANFAATTYDWDNMPIKLDENSTQTQIDAVAKLMFHCGVAMHMNYGPTESGIKDADSIVYAVKNYFRYNPNTHTIRKAQYTEAEWIAVLKAQLNAGQPMVYTGIAPSPGKGGHAFVCDGYDSEDYFHFNWGWGGLANDTYFSVQALTPSVGGTGAGDRNYTDQQAAIVDMTPRTAANTANLQLNSDWNLSSSSIVYGGSISANVSVKNFGTSEFTGDISLLVLDKNFNYFNSLPLKIGYTLNPGAVVSLNPSVQQYVGLIPGQYYVTLVYSNDDLGLQLVGSEYHTNAAMFTVYYYAELEMYSDINITNVSGSHELLRNKETTITATIKNNSNTAFTGLIGLVLFKDDMSVGEDFGTISIEGSGIAAGGTKVISCVGTTTLEPTTYILGYMYQRNGGSANFVGSRYYSNPSYVIVREPAIDFSLTPGKYVIVANRDKTDDKNWYYMTSDLGTASTKRFQAVTTGTENINEIAISDLEDKYVWTLEADGTNWKLKNGTKYVTWSSGNSANLGSAAKSLTFDVEENQVLAHFNDGSAERYLSLNATSSNNYFAFYSGTNQIEQLYFLPYDDGSTPITPPTESDRYVVLAQRDASFNWFYMTSDLGSASTKRYQAVDAGTNVLANVSSAGLADKYYWEIEDNKLKTAAGYSTWTSGNSANLDATGKELTIQPQADGTYTFSFADGDNTRYLAMNKTAGNDYFAYYNGTNQIYKLTLVKEGADTPTAIENPSEESIHDNPIRKVIEDGHLYILLPNGTRYTATGVKVE